MRGLSKTITHYGILVRSFQQVHFVARPLITGTLNNEKNQPEYQENSHSKKTATIKQSAQYNS